jgi:hypothetical protein
MSRDENEFQKLLSDAPAAPDADTLTVFGVLARTADPARFMLTLPNGRSEALEVAAVKSARKVAGVIGQPLVELVLERKMVPEHALNILSSGGSLYNPAVPIEGIGTRAHKDVYELTTTVTPFVAGAPQHVGPEARAELAAFGGNRTYLTAYVWTGDHHIYAPVEVANAI